MRASGAQRCGAVNSKKKLKLRLCRAVPSKCKEMEETGDEVCGLETETSVSDFGDVAPSGCMLELPSHLQPLRMQ